MPDGRFARRRRPAALLCFSGFVCFIRTASVLHGQISNAQTGFCLRLLVWFRLVCLRLSWVGNALLIDAAAFGWLYPLTLLAAGAFFGLFAGIPAALAWYFKNTYARWLAFASFWVILEWIRSFIFTGFPWNLLGSVLAFDDRGLQLASFSEPTAYRCWCFSAFRRRH